MSRQHAVVFVEIGDLELRAMRRKAAERRERTTTKKRKTTKTKKPATMVTATKRKSA